MLKNFWRTKSPRPVAEEAVPEPQLGQLCSVFSSYSPIEANIVGGMLRDNGIEAVLSNEFIAAVESPISNVTGGVQVFVRAADAARAGELLREASPAE